MFGNSKKMLLISSSSTSNEWPQNNHHIDEKSLNIMDPSTTTLTNRSLIEKQQQQQQQLPPLKCPRCDSMNTKFCYYNNYSLSQPRHFCKACKRYWTRGGTLRNVPVGGGCRKNKRVRRSNADGSTSSSSNITTTTTTQNPNPQILSSQAHTNTSNHMSSLFYSPMSNLSNLGLANPSNHSLSHGFGLSSLGLGIGSIGGGENNGFMNSNSSSSLLSSYNPMFGSTTTTTTTPTPTPTMASLLAPNLYQNKNNNNNNGGIGILNVQGQNLDFHSSSLQDLEIRGHNINNNNEMKNVEGVGKMDQHHHWNQMEQIGLSDPSFYSWSGNNGSSVWHDPTNNIGSSLTSLI